MLQDLITVPLTEAQRWKYNLFGLTGLDPTQLHTHRHTQTYTHIEREREREREREKERETRAHIHNTEGERESALSCTLPRKTKLLSYGVGFG